MLGFLERLLLRKIIFFRRANFEDLSPKVSNSPHLIPFVTVLVSSLGVSETMWKSLGYFFPGSFTLPAITSLRSLVVPEEWASSEEEEYFCLPRGTLAEDPLESFPILKDSALGI
ncbi:unnamed protein product [Allacma fusca]|uniref:Uncharacterized protein n=1 Tax=Allacma fusca TaxID=39272 RepID=A0A8J2KTX2_9HEXA|nr:unnamed protein product [Allacma fusca]